MFVRMALTVCLLLALPAADALASGGGGFSLGLRGRRARRADVVVVQPAYQQVVAVQKVRQVQRVRVVQQPVYGSYSSFSSVYAAPVYAAPTVIAAPVYAPPVYAQPVQQQYVQPVQQYAAPAPVAAGSLDLQLGDLTRLMQKIACVAECFATP